MSFRGFNSYDILMWWSKVLHSCNTEEQFKNALNLWPRVIKLTPCVYDAWQEVVCAAKNKLNRIVPPLNLIEKNRSFAFEIDHPKTADELIRHIFNSHKPPAST